MIIGLQPAQRQPPVGRRREGAGLPVIFER